MFRLYLKLTFLVIFFFNLSNLIAQKENNIWYFGKNAGIDFNGNSPVALTDGMMSTFEGCVSVCNNSGALLFYTDGNTIWNKKHQIMANGTGLMGDNSSTQSAIAVKMPGRDFLYYVFTVDNTSGANGLRYSIIDMSSQGGLGAVTPKKNVLITSPTTEKIAAVLHSNQKDFWIVTHEFKSNAFHSYLLSSSGFNSTPVISRVGSIITGNTSTTVGYLKFSRNGKRAAVANYSTTKTAELFDFDNSTGKLSNPIVFTGMNEAYGVEFSPNSNVLYVSIFRPVTIYQFDLLAGSNSNIINSKKTIVSNSSSSSGGGALQLGPDDIIYHAVFNLTHLGEIQKPNSLGNNSDYVAKGVSLNGKVCQLGLPTFQNFSEREVCFGDSTKFTTLSSFGSEPMDSIFYNFGDVNSGSENVSRDSFPFHIFSDTGSYLVTRISYFRNVKDTNFSYIDVFPNPKFTLGKDTSICPSSTFTLDSKVPDASYLWQDNSSDSFLNITKEGTYWVEVTSKHGCKERDSIKIDLRSLEIDLGKDTSFCVGDSLILNATTTNATYSWKDNSKDSILTVKNSGFYWVEITKENCNLRDGINITVKPKPIVNLGKDTTICEGENFLLRATTMNATYTWQDASTDSTFLVSKKGTYKVKVNIDGCSDSNSIKVDHHILPPINLGEDTSLCEGDTLTLSLNIPQAKYLWKDNSTDSTIRVTTSGTYWVKVSMDICSKADSIEVTFKPNPKLNLIESTELCEGDTFLLNAFEPKATYLWQDNSKDSIFAVTKSGVYWVKATLDQCNTWDTSKITVVPVPKVNVGKDTTLCEGEVLILNTTNPNASYEWQDGTKNATFQVEKQGEYWVKVTIGNCPKEDTILVNYSTVSMVDIGEDSTLCEGESILLDATNVGSEYLWGDASTKPTLKISKAGIYWVEVKKDNCLKRDSIQVKYNLIPVFNLREDTILCEGETITLDATTSNSSYLWQDGSVDSRFKVVKQGEYRVKVTKDNCYSIDTAIIEYILFPKANLGVDTVFCIADTFELDVYDSFNSNYLWQDNSTNSSFEALSDGVYWVQSSNICGIASDTIYLSTRDCNCYLFIPSSFTPNTDGKNENFTAVASCDLKEYNLSIFNRWGEHIFESNDIKDAWDGTFKGSISQNGAYIFLLTSRFEGERRIIKRGIVTLIR